MKTPVQSWRRRHALHLVVAAQFVSSVADNALLIVAIGMLTQRHSAAWMVPALRLFFYLSYVVLGPFSGKLADAFPKGRVMFATNLVKLIGCLLLIAQVHPLLAYALVGLGAGSYGPAKYGILTELLPEAELVKGNAWLEVSTVLSILLGVAVGSLLMAAPLASTEQAASIGNHASLVLMLVYGVAALLTAAIPASGVRYIVPLTAIGNALPTFQRACRTLWRDPEGQISLAVTCLFWAVSATLQFVILRWASVVLHLSLSQAALLQCVVAIGVVIGAVAAARWVPTHRALVVLPLGLAIGLGVFLMTLVTALWSAVALLVVIGALSGLFLVPMNALLQQRGAHLMHSGESIAVQAFNENVASLIVLAMYGTLVWVDLPLQMTIAGFGATIAIVMALIVLRQGTLLRRARWLSATST